MPESPPDYKVYRSRSGLRQRLPSAEAVRRSLRAFRRRPSPDDPYGLRKKRGLRRGRVLRYALYAALGWFVL
jgi:hypothetical protein